MDTNNVNQQIEELRKKPVLTNEEGRNLKKLEKILLIRSAQSSQRKKKIIKTVLYVIVGVVVVTGIGLYLWHQIQKPKLPPIDMTGHIEQNPKSHILDSPMSESIQKHMLEHADGETKNGQGIIIQYNCTEAFVCEKGLVNKLKRIVKNYPKNVYLAPGNYQGVIILTKLGKREILNSFNEQKIIDFITQ